MSSMPNLDQIVSGTKGSTTPHPSLELAEASLKEEGDLEYQLVLRLSEPAIDGCKKWMKRSRNETQKEEGEQSSEKIKDAEGQNSPNIESYLL